MYSEGSVKGKASTIGIEISPAPPPFFTGGQKVWNLASFSTSLNFGPPAFKIQQDSRTLKEISYVWITVLFHMSSPSLVKMGPCTHLWEPFVSRCAPPPKIRYLGMFNACHKIFRCFTDHAKRSFYRAKNAIFAMVALPQKRWCLPIHTYWLEVCAFLPRRWLYFAKII